MENLLEEYLDHLPAGTVVNRAFGFIPVVSALDIKRNGGQVTVGDYHRHYAGGNLPLPELTSGFDNFIVGFTEGIFQNYPHISFQQRNGNWLANELNEQLPNNLIDCSYVCDATTISGPDQVCSNGTFSSPQGFDSVLWSIIPSNAGSVTSGNGSTMATFNFNLTYNGYATISAQLISTECGTYVITKQIWRGKPATPTLGGISNVMVGSIVSYSANAHGAATYEWSLPGNFQVVGSYDWDAPYWQLLASSSSQPNIPAYTGTQAYEGDVAVRACNPCGCSDTAYFAVQSGGPGAIGMTPEHPEIDPEYYLYTVYPNPADIQITIGLRDINKTPRAGAVISGKLYNLYGILQENVSIMNNQAVVDVSGLTQGIYVLNINIDSDTETHIIAVN